MWVERDGSPKYLEDVADARSLTRSWDAKFGTGRSQATSNGVIRGTTFVWDSLTFVCQTISVENTQGHDLVTATYNLYGSNQVAHSRDPGAAFNDGVVRHDGDQEWSVQLGVDQQQAKLARAFDGSSWSSINSWGLGENGQDIPVKQPSIYLIWRLWMNKYGVASFALPITRQRALEAVNSYVPNGAGTYDIGTPRPRLFHVLGRNGLDAKFLCVGIELEADGNLVCRVARYEYLNIAWQTMYPGLFGS